MSKLPMFPVPPSPPPPGGPGAGLAGLTSLFDIWANLAKTITGRYYKNEVIYLDGYTFVNCCFHNCDLVTDIGTFSLRSCTIANVQWRYGPNAVRILRSWHTHFLTPLETFRPQIAEDGAVTIG